MAGAQRINRSQGIQSISIGILKNAFQRLPTIPGTQHNIADILP